MRFKLLRGSGKQPGVWRAAGARTFSWASAGAAIVAVVVVLSSAQTQQPPSRPPRPVLSPEANRPPDANQVMEMREQKARKQNFDAANAERLRQMTEASKMLETMAIALKAEVDKTSSGRLSESAIHKAETIEKLARIVKEEMKLTVGPS